jgi:hypothetical protein
MTMARQEILEELEGKVRKLIATTWAACGVSWPAVRRWLDQFSENSTVEEDEQLHAFFLLTHFLYFDQEAIRVLLKAVFRDLFRTPSLHSIRKSRADTLDSVFLEQTFAKELAKTRFLGAGNPSESGAHLLYYFRQANGLDIDYFINSQDMFRAVQTSAGLSMQIRDTSVRRYVFIDDLCGSGTQAKQYLKDSVGALKALDPTVRTSYFLLFATSVGLSEARALGCFDDVEAIFELDQTFKALEPESRIFNPPALEYDRLKVRRTCESHGKKLWPQYPLGYKDGQLLLGMSHNTPDNALPIFWRSKDDWQPIFKRYHK